MIYEPLVKVGYEWVNVVDDADYEIFYSFDGTSRVTNWKEVRVKRVRADERQECRESDFPWLGTHALVLRERAVHKLRQVIEPHAEILPLKDADGASLYVLNVLNVVDALDEEKSAVIRFPSTRRIMRVTRPCFREPLIRGLDLFRLPFRASPTYVSQRFVDAVADAKLLGIEFRLTESARTSA